ncbi:pentapeptide repeat-containing protein [Sphingobacterium multivorum]|uniref:pentapeptide repeat-containing protein n=1 Tax=Sphingobacterium multivorum TaxID=28454 RepID=UPI00301A6864
MALTNKIFQQSEIESFEFNHKVLKNCSFIDCKIKGKSFMNSMFRDCKFIRCTFVDCNFQSVVFQESGLWMESTFEANDFSKAIIGNLKIEKSSFLYNTFDKTTFDGTNLIHVVFKGKISSSWFYGIPFTEDLYSTNLFILKKAKPLKTPLVNFGHAELKDVIFSRGLDLSSTVFPNQEHLKIINNPRRFFNSFLKRSREVFTDNESLVFCRDLVDNVLYKPENRGMPVILVDLNQFYPSLNENRDRLIVDLLKAG